MELLRVVISRKPVAIGHALIVGAAVEQKRDLLVGRRRRIIGTARPSVAAGARAEDVPLFAANEPAVAGEASRGGHARAFFASSYLAISQRADLEESTLPYPGKPRCALICA